MVFMVPLLIMATSLVSKINTRVALVKGWVNSFLAFMGQLYIGFYNPDLNGIFAANEPGVIGAAEAVKRAGKSGKIVIIGWDAAPDELTAVQNRSEERRVGKEGRSRWSPYH